MKKSIIIVIAVIAALALFLCTALFGLNLGIFKINSVSDGVMLGLDLVGGSEITYEANIPEGTSSDDVSSGMNSAIAMLRARLDMLDYTEANVYLSGTSRIVVEIPNVTDPVSVSGS